MACSYFAAMHPGRVAAPFVLARPFTMIDDGPDCVWKREFFEQFLDLIKKILGRPSGANVVFLNLGLQMTQKPSLGMRLLPALRESPFHGEWSYTISAQSNAA